MHGVVPPQMQDPAFALVESHEVPLRPTLQPVHVSLNGSTAFWCMSHSSHFCAISKIASPYHPKIQGQLFCGTLSSKTFRELEETFPNSQFVCTGNTEFNRIALPNICHGENTETLS